VALDFLRFYLVANALLALAALMLVVARAVNARLRRPMSYRAQLYLAYGLIFAALLGSLLSPLSGGAELLPAMTQVWAAPSMHAVAIPGNALKGVTVSAGTSATSVPLEAVARAIGIVCLIGIALAMGRTLGGAWSVRRVLRRAQLIRASGSLRVVSSDDADVPFSCWLPGACYIVVPSALILRPGDFAIALRHEAQHHRQGDTRVVYVTELLRGVFFLNPLLPLLLKRLRALQEFACDEALLRRVEPREYCECLIRVARSAMRSPRPLSCLHMAGPEGDSMLSRRIAALLKEQRERLARWKVITLNVIAIIALLATGVGLSASVQDKRVSLSQALEMAAVARTSSAFPIVVNEQVLTELNRFLGTPDGRAFLRDGLKRMSDHEELISARLAKHGLPRELLAVPLVESGYRNLEQSANPRHGAGIWMFIKPTARRFGLTVEGGYDERLNIASETDAAMRMLSGLHDEFGDWNFALLAYNSGSERIRRAVRDGGDTPDAFQAAEQGYENDPGYLARVTAAVIVLKNTSRLRLAAAP
jgi:membrane-bound lytic murein transglycosylase D